MYSPNISTIYFSSIFTSNGYKHIDKTKNRKRDLAIFILLKNEDKLFEFTM